MPEIINLNIKIDVVDGPKLSEIQNIEVEAYEKLTIKLEKKVSDIEVDIQPGGEGQVKFLMIKIENPEQYGKEVKYKLTKPAADPKFVLDRPLILFGLGAISLLGPPKKLYFTNDWEGEVQLQILVGRDATP